MKPAHLLLLIVMNVFWAGSYASFKALAPYLDAGGIATLRFGVAAGMLVLAWPWLPGATPRGRDLLKNIAMGIAVFVCAPRLQVAGVQRGQAGDAAVLMGLEPLITSIAAALFLREHIGPRRWIGFALGLSGVLFMAQIWQPDFHLPGLAANVLFVSSFVCEAVYSVAGKPLLERAGLVKILTIALVAGTGVNLAIDGSHSLAAVKNLPPHAWLLLFYLSAICTVAGYIVWFVVIRVTDVSVTVLTVFLQPVIGVLIAAFVLKEALHWGQLWGCLAIILGLVIGLSRQLKTQERSSRSTPGDAH